jgi:hypothetical protein
VESQAIGLLDGHADLLGRPSWKGGNWNQLGRDGETYRFDKSLSQRYMTLTVATFDRNFEGLITEADRCDQLDVNIDTLLGLIDGRFIIERDVLGETRWIQAELAADVTAVSGPVFGQNNSAYTFLIPVRCPYPLWQSETLNQTVISGAGTISNAGNARIPNAEFVFSGDGTFTNSDGDEEGNSYGMTISGSGAAVTVDVGAGTVVESGSPADNTFTADKAWWMRLGRTGDIATVNVTSTVSVTVNHRDQWF